tara:strand:+ start:528 stop:749 length:222 start_codon:yes stop_codon:yes gene_type:complete
MYKIILILVVIITIYLFIDIYKKVTESNDNQIIKNLEQYAKKEEIKQQESKILGQKKVKRKSDKKKRTRMYHL